MIEHVEPPDDGHGNAAPGSAAVAPEQLAAVHALRSLSLAVEAFRSSVAGHFDLGIRDTEAVSYIRAMGPMSQQRLGQRLRLTPGSVTALVDRLEHSGMAHRRPAAHDRRVVEVWLTQRAHDYADVTVRLLADCLAGVPSMTQPASVQAMDALAAAIHAVAESDPLQDPPR